MEEEAVYFYAYARQPESSALNMVPTYVWGQIKAGLVSRGGVSCIACVVRGVVWCGVVEVWCSTVEMWCQGGTTLGPCPVHSLEATSRMGLADRGRGDGENIHLPCPFGEGCGLIILEEVPVGPDSDRRRLTPCLSKLQHTKSGTRPMPTPPRQIHEQGGNHFARQITTTRCVLRK